MSGFLKFCFGIVIIVVVIKIMNAPEPLRTSAVVEPGPAAQPHVVAPLQLSASDLEKMRQLDIARAKMV